ncbi:hypothetical protein BXZ70DRAFT_417758 [Cristinia sonorae]|uniref:Sm domain-containing protein n=1 Tax=Cristinia sonorae TaxID=1940300 RepID=A0A8K0UWA8_9AGAR|nr:hypothetical protein BXZ70DRAFT_417758 [Cristinia sonorae]
MIDRQLVQEGSASIIYDILLLHVTTMSAPLQNEKPALAHVKQFLNKPLRITITDQRIFLGTFVGTDKQLNILLVNTDEYRFTPPELANPNGRFVGLVMIPRRLIVRVEVSRSGDEGAEVGKGDMYA